MASTMTARRGSRRIRMAWAAAVAVATMVALAGPAAAQDSGTDGEPAGGATVDQPRAQAGAELGLVVESAIAGQAQAAWLPVVVTVSPQVPVDGVMQVQREGTNGTTTIEVDVEVAAGATKRWTLLVPPGENRTVVTLRSGDTTATESLPAAGGGAAVAGVLGDPEFGDRVGAVTDVITGQVWQTAAIDPAVLDLGPLALETIGTLTASQDALADLDDDQRATIAAAVNLQGLHLVVTDVTQDPGIGRAPAAPGVDGLDVAPSAWPLAIDGDDVVRGPVQGAMGATATSGLGRVTWLDPSVAPASLDAPRTWGQLWTGTPLTTAFAWSRNATLDPWALQQSGLRLPSSWAMTAFAASYLVVIGVVALVVVRRLRRRERAWVVLPAVAMVVATVAFAASSTNAASPGRSLAHSSWIDGQGLEQVALVVPPEVDEGVTMPGPGWAIESLAWDNPMVTRPTADGVEIGQQDGQQAFGVGIMMATRAAPSQPPLAIEAVHTPAGVRAEVTNTSAVAMTDLRVTAEGAGKVDVPSLAPGATTLVQFTATATFVDDVEVEDATATWAPLPDDDAFGEDMMIDPGFGPGGFDGPASSFEGVSNRTVAMAPGMVWVQAVATTPMVPTPAGPATVDPDVVTVGVRPTVDPEAPSRGASLVWQPTTGNVHEHNLAAGMLFGGGTTWIRTTVPAGAVAGQVQVDVPRTEESDGCVDYDVWDDENGQSRLETLCDGQGPECPDDAIGCDTWPQGASMCFEDGCETWELRFDNSMAVAVWDREEQAFRSWDDDFEDQVAADPDRIVTPLGDVVVEVSGSGEFLLNRIDIGTGGQG